MYEGELMGFNECPEDAFDDQADKVYRLVSCYDVMLLHSERGKRLDEVVRQFPEVNDPNIEDGYRVKAEVTIGWLRCVNVLAGLLQQELRVVTYGDSDLNVICTTTQGATVEWMSETELTMWIKKCKEIVKEIEA